MRVIGHFLAVLTACGTLALAQAPTPADRAAKVLADARTALGGEQKIAAVKNFTSTGRTRRVQGDNLVPIEFEVAVELPDKYQCAGMKSPLKRAIRPQTDSMARRWCNHRR